MDVYMFAVSFTATSPEVSLDIVVVDMQDPPQVRNILWVYEIVWMSLWRFHFR